MYQYNYEETKFIGPDVHVHSAKCCCIIDCILRRVHAPLFIEWHCKCTAADIEATI
jgi:hypothetical protein